MANTTPVRRAAPGASFDQPEPRRVLRFIPVLLPATVGLALVVSGRTSQGRALLALAGLALLLALLGVRTDRWVGRAALVIAEVVSALTSWAVGLLLVCIGVVCRVVRRDVLRDARQGRRRKSGWSPATRGASTTAAERPFTAGRSYQPGTGGHRTLARSLVRGIPVTLGFAVIVLAVNLGIGLGWQATFSADRSSATINDAINFTGTTPTRTDPRAGLPAMAESPWSVEYFKEIQLTPSSYWPFTESRPREFHGKYVNIDGWDRRSYHAASTTPGNSPTVWMFGGSTTWGEGQRDGYTIASYVSRIAEAAGTPVIVRNFGQRGWTHFQEMILFEQLLASEPRPDIAIFYDGANEINAQTESAKGVPTHTLADQYAAKLSGGIGPEFNKSPSQNVVQDAWDSYVEHSAIHMAVRSIKHTLFPIAGASDRSTAAPRDAGQNYTKTFDDARRAVDVYDRGRSITQFLATGHHVEPVFFWQPVVQGPVEHLADSLIDSPTLNISDTLDDHPEVYIDGGHTNERGAELVAERIWKTIGSKTRHWYRANPRASGGDVRSTSTSTSLVALPSTSASPQAAAADSNQELLDQARLQLDQALGHPCALKEFTPWITLMRASNPSEIAQVGELAQRYFVGLAAAAPSSAAAAAEAVRRAAPSFSSLIASASYDPKQPILPQLAGVVDPVFLRSLQTLIDAQTTTCISTNHTGR